jgi:hypothetical protein
LGETLENKGLGPKKRGNYSRPFEGVKTGQF